MDKLAKQLRDKEKQKEAKLVQQAERRLAEKRKGVRVRGSSRIGRASTSQAPTRSRVESGWLSAQTLERPF
eukprot:522477-Prymnesium_polylepis.1